MSEPPTAASVVRRVLEQYGVRSVFALAGASQSVLLDECDRHGIRVVQSRHEAGTVGAADGYARMRRGIGVALINADQGMANAVTGVQSALEACTPVVVLVGREPHSWIEPELAIDHDALVQLRPVSKWARTCHSAHRLGEYIEIACRKALAGRPGPCVVAYPNDLLRQKVTPGVDVGAEPPGLVRSAPDSTAIDTAARLLARAERPLLIAGSGAYYSGAADVLRRLSARYGLPVLTHGMGRGLVEEDLDHGWPWPVAQTAAKLADVVVWAGARLSRRFGYGLAPRFSSTATMIQIDLCAEELSRNRPIDVPMLADVKLALEQLDTALGALAPPRRSVAWLREALKERTRIYEEKAAATTERVNPYRIGTELMKLLGRETLLVNDGAAILTRMFGVLRFAHPGSYIDTYPLGSMGMGTPMAIGAATLEQELAAADGRAPRRVVLVTGDGAFGFYPGELASAVMENLALTVVIANNSSWGNEVATQPETIGRLLNAHLGDIDYASIGRGLGVASNTVVSNYELPAALDEALSTQGPSLLDVRVTEPPFEASELTILYSDVERTRAAHFSSDALSPFLPTKSVERMSIE